MNNKNQVKLAVVIILLFLLLLPIINKDSYFLGVFIIAFFNIILAATFRQIMNIGYMNIAHVSFMGIGAYTSGFLSLTFGLSFWLCLPLAGIVSGVMALGMGYGTLRIKGFYFVMMTVALVEAVRMAVMISPHDWLGGATGLSNIPIPNPIVIPKLFKIEFESRVSIYYLNLIAMILFLVALYSIEKSRLGLVFRAIKDSDQLAQHLGINIMKYKVAAFVFSLAIVGFVGSLYAHYFSIIAPQELGFMGTAWSIIHCVIGGWGSIAGPIIGASLITFLLEFLRPFKQYMPIFFGFAITFTLLFMPDGLIGIPKKISRFVKRN